MLSRMSFALLSVGLIGAPVRANENLQLKIVTVHGHGMIEKHIPLGRACYELPSFDSSTAICSCSGSEFFWRVINHSSRAYRVITSSCVGEYVYVKQQNYQVLFFDGSGTLVHKLDQHVVSEAHDGSKTGAQSMEIQGYDELVTDSTCATIEGAARKAVQSRIEQIRRKLQPFRCRTEDDESP